VDLAASGLADVALNVHGTRLVQKMVECADTHSQKAAITAAIMLRLMELIRDMNANHVVQRCLAALPLDLAAGIYDRITAECLTVATHRYGSVSPFYSHPSIQTLLFTPFYSHPT
jgi:hypothetical protein